MTVGGKITRDSILYSWCVRREYFMYYESISKEMFRLVVSRVNEKAELCIFALCFALYGKIFRAILRVIVTSSTKIHNIKHLHNYED